MPLPLALITGVSRREGLGFETAKQLIDKNYPVIISARDKRKVFELAAEIGAIPLVLDVSDDVSVNALAGTLAKDMGVLDVLINNAGAYFDQGNQLLSTDVHFIMDAINTNLLGAFRMIKALRPLLSRSSNPAIVNVSSGAGSFHDPVFGLSKHPSGVPVYSLTKLALNGLTMKMAKELSAEGIKINSVCPGFVATYPGTQEWGARPVSKGARGIVWAATLPKDGPTGGFFRDGQVLDW